MHCFVGCKRDGDCLAERAHSHEIVGLQGLFDVLDVVRDALREDSDSFFKVPGLIGIQTEMHSWSSGITHGGYALNLFVGAQSQPYF